ncbi:MAG TPA: hypothetical protein VK163_14510 [Opitutaceae bacterium]|nr:hypothetical protein [Opitutaceae bacterium]
MIQVGLLQRCGEADVALGGITCREPFERGPEGVFGSEQVVSIGRRDRSIDFSQQFESPPDVRSTLHFEEAFHVLRVQRRGRVDEDPRARRERQPGVAGHVQPVERLARFAHQPRPEPDDVLRAPMLLCEPFEVKPLVALVRHHHAPERGIAPDQLLQQPIHAGGLPGAGVAGEEEMSVRLVARPLKPGERQRNRPPVRHDPAVRSDNVAPVVGVIEEQRRQHRKGRADAPTPHAREPRRADQARAGDDQRERQR